MSAPTIEPFPIIEISGTPMERGYSYGRQLGTRIRASIAHYKRQASDLSLCDRGIARVVQRYLPLVESFGAHYVEEMRGIAAGADVSFDDIFLLNARTEVLKIAMKPELQERFAHGDPPDGCTSVTVTPEASLNGQLIHAQNWDWKEECARTGVVIRVRRDDGPDFLAFTEAGMLARSGLNAAGVAVTGNNLESDRDYTRIGIPLPFIRRKVLESEYVAHAVHAVYATPKSGSNNMAVSHRDGFVVNFECAPDETFCMEPEGGLLVHSNHWLSPIALGKLKDTGVALSPCTLYRHRRVRELLRSHVGSITPENVKSALLDNFQSPWSVCRPPREDLGRPTRSATVATIVMQPSLGVMEIANLPALRPEFTRYTLVSGANEVRAA